MPRLAEKFVAETFKIFKIVCVIDNPHLVGVRIRNAVGKNDFVSDFAEHEINGLPQVHSAVVERNGVLRLTERTDCAGRIGLVARDDFGGDSCDFLFRGRSAILKQAAFRAGFRRCGQEELVFRIGKNHGSDVASLHDDERAVRHFALPFDEFCADRGNRRDCRSSRGNFGSAERIAWNRSVDFEFQSVRARNKTHRGVCEHVIKLCGIGVLRIDSELERLPCRRAVHGTGVDVNCARDRLREHLRRRAFAGCGGTVYCDCIDCHISLSHS